jgi:hypothetical protein
MATKELKAALRQITAVLTDPRVNPGQRDRLLKARRELENIARCRKSRPKTLWSHRSIDCGGSTGDRYDGGSPEAGVIQIPYE